MSIFVPDSEKEGRKNALKKLLSMMGEGAADDISAFKASKSMQSGDELGDVDGKTEIELEIENGDELTEDGAGPAKDEIEMIKHLYEKYCM